ncbi:hypothetical protein DHEL01_v204072 [Diaporthe helianthi]|uniref:Transcriptional regulator n=1 Tax=Diaporthe helianthi TaxID=158607 RepID=A0A2P5I505_DIAHE|nr:hypothetical protein DHEL01_v204072 [Diaporthe helianthi]
MGDKALEASLVAAVKELFSGPGRDDLSVNTVRTKCEKENGLEEGFFAKGGWKAKSKELIKSQVNELVAEEESGKLSASPVSKSPKPKSKGKNAQKNGSQQATPKAVKPAPKKRQTKAAPKVESDSESERSDPPDEDEDKEEDEASDGYEEEKPKPKKAQPKKAKAPARGRKRKAAESDDEEKDEKSSVVADGIGVSTTGVKKEEPDDKEDSPLSDAPKSENEDTKPSVAAAKVEDDSSELSSVIDDEPPQPKKQRKTKAAPAKKTKSAVEDDNDDSSELSSVIDDEPPPPKKQRKLKETAGGNKKTGVTKAGRKSGSTGAAEEANPDEAWVKKLQGQLVKCGVRKIWGVELKGCGGDAKAKIRHLRQLLRDVGMDGRFSEARAREIKDQRELAAELEAVNEMNDLWGVGGRRGRRAAAPKRKLAEDSGDDDNNDDGEGGGKGDGGKEEHDSGFKETVTKDGSDEDEDSDAPKVSGRSRKVRPELAFLGDDDSDED